MAELFSRYESGVQFTAGAMTGSVSGVSGINPLVDRVNSVAPSANTLSGTSVVFYGAHSNLTAGEGIDINGGSVIVGEDASTTNKGVASFSSAQFSVSNGAVSITESSINPTSLGANCVAGNHGTATTDMIINACYGTGSTPPTASTTTEGTLYIQYTA